jgi:UDP-2,4-diacetamido-2,4,6-trideoxy-beta-L-altropyranose hydrolase
VIDHQIVIRTDASLQIGTGHVMRCLTLADALRSAGAHCHFICKELPGNCIAKIRQRGFMVSVLPVAIGAGITNNLGIKDQLGCMDSLGSDWFADAEQTKAKIGSMVVDWLIVDHYSIDARWEDLLRPFCRHLMIIDDIANRQHSCDLLIDQNYTDELRYRSYVTEDCRLLLGPIYALLRPEYASYRAFKAQQAKVINRVMVFFGGTDPLDLTGATLKALSAPGLNNLELDIVVGANYLNYELLVQQAFLRGRTTIHKPRPHLADLMAIADIAIGAGGSTNWERICLGLPSIVISFAENQIPISEILHRLGVIRLLGKSEDVSIDCISAALLCEIQLRQISGKSDTAMKLCDGLGVDRVLNVMNSIK